jgi:nucleoside-triphosphatase
VLTEISTDAGGFYTSEVCERGRRVGFSITDLRGPTGILAHVDIGGAVKVGKYGVNREDLENIGVSAIEAAILASRLIVMDELGRMELCSDIFQTVVVRALDCPKPVLGTIQASRNRFLDAIRSRDDTEIHELTTENREPVRRLVLDRLTRVLSGL